MIYFLLYSDLCYLTFNDLYLKPVANRRAIEPNFSLVNREGLDKILKAGIFVNEDNGQLRVAYLILGITPVSHAFQVPKCVIKNHDPHLHCISIVVEGFLLPESAPIPEGSFSAQPILFPGPTIEGTQSSTPTPEGIPKVGASSSQQFTRMATSSCTRNLEEEEEVVEVRTSLKFSTKTCPQRLLLLTSTHTSHQ